MKKLLTGLLCLTMSVTLLAQGRVSTRKYILNDFPDKVTKVVLSGDAFLNNALRQEVVRIWTASPFEFCTLPDFEKLRLSDEYYFLMPAATRFKGEKEAETVFLMLLKGGPEAAEGLGAMYEVISLPLASAESSSGRELTYVGPLVQAVQEFTLAAMESEKVAYSREQWFNARFGAEGRMKQLYMADEDLSLSVDETALGKYKDEDFHVVTADQADEMFLQAPYNTLVSYVVAPTDPTNASYSYQMLFEAESGELFYFSKHRIQAKSKAGFTVKDLKWLSKRR